MKKLLVGMTTALMMIGSTSVFANEKLILDKYTIEEASELTGFTIEDLLEYEIQLDDYSLFESEVEKFIDMFDKYNVEDDVDSIIYNPGLSFNVSSYADIGDIHITSQGEVSGYAHGHVALAISSTQNLETLGGKTLSAVRSNSGWNNYKEYALLRVKDSSANFRNKVNAVNYGINNLQDLEYYALSSINGSKVNCESLVAKAYKDSGVLDILQSNSVLTVFPEYFVTSNHTEIVVEENFPW